MSVSLTWKKRLDARQIGNRYVNDRVMQYAHLQLWRLCSKYVPMKTGYLMENTEITPEYLRYKAPYAARIAKHTAKYARKSDTGKADK